MRVARYLADVIGAATGPKPPRVEAASGTPRAGSVRLVLTPSGPAAAGTLDESYELAIAPDRITIAAPNAAGLFYGVQTLRQLLPPWVEYRAAAADKARVLVAPAGRIVDRPRFAWRGAMLDVARHFFDVRGRQALHRPASRSTKSTGCTCTCPTIRAGGSRSSRWPKLTTHGGSTEVGGGTGGFYTQDEYARSRRVRARSVHHDRSRDRHAGPHERRAVVVSRAELRRRGARRSTPASTSASARSASTRTSPTRSSTMSCGRSRR